MGSEGAISGRGLYFIWLCFWLNRAKSARIAQLVEHLHGKEGVVGSSPIPGFLVSRGEVLAPVLDPTLAPGGVIEGG
jgi:hypothetical protein